MVLIEIDNTVLRIFEITDTTFWPNNATPVPDNLIYDNDSFLDII